MKKIYIKPTIDVVVVSPLSVIAGSPLPASVPGGFPGIGGGIKANPFDDVEDMTDFDSQIKGLLW